MIITIDGPSGTGKSTVARKVADRLHFVYFDTGAMYRAFTWLVIERNIPIDDPQAVMRCLEEFDYKIVEINQEKHYFVGAIDITQAIRSRAVTKLVSPVSALRQVRSFLLDFQYRFAKTQDAVFEGRDLGTVVFPKAELKIFLTADPHIRAKRRLQEIIAKHPEEVEGLREEQMLADIMSRDEYDSNREVAPLCRAPDAYPMDTTNLSIDQVVDQIVKWCVEKFPERKFV
jgi:cytidylate kinase